MEVNWRKSCFSAGKVFTCCFVSCIKLKTVVLAVNAWVFFFFNQCKKGLIITYQWKCYSEKWGVSWLACVAGGISRAVDLFNFDCETENASGEAVRGLLAASPLANSSRDLPATEYGGQLARSRIPGYIMVLSNKLNSNWPPYRRRTFDLYSSSAKPKQENANIVWWSIKQRLVFW